VPDHGCFASDFAKVLLSQLPLWELDDKNGPI
jgi:hypothetical protein